MSFFDAEAMKENVNLLFNFLDKSQGKTIPLSFFGVENNVVHLAWPVPFSSDQSDKFDSNKLVSSTVSKQKGSWQGIPVFVASEMLKETINPSSSKCCLRLNCVWKRYSTRIGLGIPLLNTSSIRSESRNPSETDARHALSLSCHECVSASDSKARKICSCRVSDSTILSTRRTGTDTQVRDTELKASYKGPFECTPLPSRDSVMQCFCRSWSVLNWTFVGVKSLDSFVYHGLLERNLNR